MSKEFLRKGAEKEHKTGEDNKEQKFKLELELGLEPASFSTHFALYLSWQPPMVLFLVAFRTCPGSWSGHLKLGCGHPNPCLKQ